MDSEKRDLMMHTGESEALMLKLDELHPRLEDLRSRTDELIGEIDDPPPTHYGQQTKIRFAVLLYAGLAIIALNLSVYASIGGANVQSNLVVMTLLFVSNSIGLAFVLFAYASTPTRKRLSLDAQRARRESLRMLKLEARQVDNELHRTYRRLDALERGYSEAAAEHD